jgi:hypothetical protein
MPVFLQLYDRYPKALDTFDPLQGDWLCRFIDPWPWPKRDGRPRWLRLAVLLVIAAGPVILFSALPSKTFGGGLKGPGGLVSDLGVYTIFILVVLGLFLIPLLRRVLGDLPRELVRLGIAPKSFEEFHARASPKTRILACFDCISRLDGHHGLPWLAGIVILVFGAYWLNLLDAIPTWDKSPSLPGSALHLFAIGPVQPNLAGLWMNGVFGVLFFYVLFLAGRLLIVFACECSALAGSEHLAISPSHSDTVGGLRPIGKVDLLFTVFTFAVGLNMAAITLNRLHWNAEFHEAVRGDFLLHGNAVTWGVYLVFGSMLFFLPLLPLRARMADAKRQYLIGAAQLFLTSEQLHKADIEHHHFDPANLQGLAALDQLISTASDMAVWPFDRKTLTRYAGLLLSPLFPLFADELPKQLLTWFQHLFRLSGGG